MEITMKIKSLEDLQRVRQENQHKVDLRKHDEIKKEKIEFSLGTATCEILEVDKK